MTAVQARIDFFVRVFRQVAGRCYGRPACTPHLRYIGMHIHDKQPELGFRLVRLVASTPKGLK